MNRTRLTREQREALRVEIDRRARERAARDDVIARSYANEQAHNRRKKEAA